MPVMSIYLGMCLIEMATPILMYKCALVKLANDGDKEQLIEGYG